MSSISDIYFRILLTEKQRIKMLPVWRRFWHWKKSKSVMFMEALARMSDLDIAKVTEDALGYQLPQFRECFEGSVYSPLNTCQDDESENPQIILSNLNAGEQQYLQSERGEMDVDVAVVYDDSDAIIEMSSFPPSSPDSSVTTAHASRHRQISSKMVSAAERLVAFSRSKNDESHLKLPSVRSPGAGSTELQEVVIGGERGDVAAGIGQLNSQQLRCIATSGPALERDDDAAGSDDAPLETATRAAELPGLQRYPQPSPNDLARLEQLRQRMRDIVSAKSALAAAATQPPVSPVEANHASGGSLLGQLASPQPQPRSSAHAATLSHEVLVDTSQIHLPPPPSRLYLRPSNTVAAATDPPVSAVPQPPRSRSSSRSRIPAGTSTDVHPLNANHIIGTATEALGPLSPTHKRFLENEPVPEQDGFFVPLNEMVAQNSARDPISPARSVHTRNTVAIVASGVSMKTATLKSQRSVGLVTCAEDRVSVDGHGDTTALSPSCSDVVPQAHKKMHHAHSQKAARALPDSAQSADYLKKSRGYTEKNERSSDKTKGNAGASLWSSAPPDTSLREVIVDIDARDLKKSQISQSQISVTSQIQSSSSSRAAVSAPFMRNTSDDLDPPPAFDEDDMKMAEALAAERRAQKAAARAARGQTSLGHSASAADTRAAVNPHYRSPSAAVEDWGLPPPFDEDDMKMAEALAAERRAQKAAARAAREQDERYAAITGMSAASHALLSSGRSLRPAPGNDRHPLPLSVPALLPTHEQKLQQPASSGKHSAGLQTGAPENVKRATSARRK